MQKMSLILLIFVPLMLNAETAIPLDKVVAVVNEDVIVASELEEQVEVLKQQMKGKTAELPPEAILRKQVLQHLIDVNLQLQLAKSHSIKVDEADINEAIEKVALSNQLTLAQLREALKQQGLDWELYRENIRKEMIMSRLQQRALAQEVVVSNQQIEEYLKTEEANQKKNVTYHLQNIVIPLPEEPTPEQVTQAEEKATGLLAQLKKGKNFSDLAIAESSDEYALEGGDLGTRHLAELPDVFAKFVVVMKKGEVKGPIRTGNGFQLIKLISASDQDQRHEVLKTHVRHILMKPSSQLTVKEAESQIKNLYEQIKSGKEFALMAKQHSLDAASALEGGDIGWVTSDELAPEFAKAMEALPLHVVSKPVHSSFGWHLIEVLERKMEDDSDAYRRQQVKQFLFQKKFTEAVQNWQQHLKTEAYVNILDRELV